jgi:hypothetical protein
MLPNGPIPVIYNSDDLLAGWRAARADLLLLKPQAVCLHGGPNALLDQHSGARVTTAAIHADLLGTKIVVAVGCDGWLADYHGGRCNEQQVVEHLLDGAQIANDLGGEVIFDAEEEWKLHPDSSAHIATLVLAGCLSRYPDLAQYHTSYGNVVAVRLPSGKWWGGQSPYPFKAWCGPASSVIAEIWQSYFAAKTGVAPRGSGQHALDLSRQSVAAGVVQGLVKAGMPDMAYVQLHHSHELDIIDVGLQRATIFGWAYPTRVDDRGRLAFRVLCALHALGFWGPTAIMDFQRATGVLKVDGICGAKTLAALGIQ